MKLKRKKLSIAEQNNYDAFLPTKNTLSMAQIHSKLSKTKSIPLEPEISKPSYIGQNLHIRPSYIVSLPAYDGGSGSRSYSSVLNQKNLLDNSHGGLISSKAVGRMKNAINWLICAAEPKKVFNKKLNSFFDFKINFVTLTLPDTSVQIDNKTLQTKLLNPFFTYLRKYYSLNNYVWKLEFQRNGKLHVHFACDTFLHHKVIRKIWNKQLANNNFLAEFFLKFGHADPNSTDVHSVRKVKNIAAYIAKYMSKDSAMLNKIKGRIWGCSQQLSQANKTSLFVPSPECPETMRPLMCSDIRFKAIEKISEFTQLPKRIGEVFFLSYIDWSTTLTGVIRDKFEETLLMIKTDAQYKNQLFTI